MTLSLRISLARIELSSLINMGRHPVATFYGILAGRADRIGDLVLRDALYDRGNAIDPVATIDAFDRAS